MQCESVQVNKKIPQQETLLYLKLCANEREQKEKAMLAPQRQQQYQHELAEAAAASSGCSNP